MTHIGEPMKRALTLVCLVAVVLASSATLAGAAPGGDPSKVRICIVAGSSPDAVVKQWYPMISYLTEEVGRPFEIVVRESYEDMLADYMKGDVDVLISGPFNYVKTADRAGANLLAQADRPSGDKLHGVIVTRSGSGIDELGDLAGKSFAFTEPYSTTGYLMPRLILAEAGIEQPADFFKEVVFSGHHSESLETVVTGNKDAAAVVSYLVDEAIRDRGIDLEIIAKTPLLPQEPIFARPGLNSRTASRIKAALLSMHERVPPDVMKRLNLERFVAGSDSDYNVIRKAEARLKKLPALPYAVDFGIVPTALSEAVDKYILKGWTLIFAIPTIALVVLVVLMGAMLRRVRSDIRFKFAFTLLAAMILIAFAISALGAANLKRRLGNISLAWERNINIFTSQGAKAAADDDASFIQSLADGLTAQEGIRYVKAFRNGKYIADSEHEDTGHSIIPKIVSGTFRPNDDDVISTTSYIMSGGKRYANVLIGLDASRLDESTRQAFLGNLVAILILLGLGIGLAIILSRTVTGPVMLLSRAVVAIRQGRKPRLEVSTRKDQIGGLVRGFQEMEAEVRRTGELLGQKSSELDETNEKLARMEEREIDFEEVIEEVEVNLTEDDARALAEIREDMQVEPVVDEEAKERARELRSHIESIEEELPKLRELRQKRIIGDSPAFLRVIRDIIIRSRDSDPVLLYGESGSGKTGVAEAIHMLGARGDRRIVEYNCAELAAADPVIVLGKLFGYGRDSGIAGVRKEGQPGLMEECDGTTLFLDEIALLPLQTQGALLLPLEGRPFNPAAGKGDPKKSDVRIIFASNVNLEDEVRAGRFRHDLLRRIKARGSLEIPPLRERMDDVGALARHFLALWCDEKRKPMTFDEEALGLLSGYDYGKFNVAELATTIKIAADNALFRESDIIKPEFFGEELSDIVRKRAQLADESRLFDETELHELGVMRKHAFRIGPSEDELGYSRDARTLSNHLRGIAYKVLSRAGWRVDGATKALAGDAPSVVLNRLRRKIEFYLKNVSRLVKAGDEKRIFNNLPQKYRAHAEEAIKRAHTSSI